MKHLLLFFLFSDSLNGFSQSVPMEYFRPKGPDTLVVKPDTLRCTLIVYYDNGPAILHTKPGFVVRGEREVYLDDKKKVIKAPWEVLTYKIKR